MNVQFYHAINVFMVSRLFFLYKDEPLTKTRLIFMSLLQLVGIMVYQIIPILGIFLIFILLLNFLLYFFEKKISKLNELRLISLITLMLLSSVFFSPWINLLFNERLLESLLVLEKYSMLINLVRKISLLEYNIILMGFLLVLNEVNLLIRYQFQLFDLIPKKCDERSKRAIIDQQEYNAGRIIGILERVIIYIAVLNNQYIAIGFILAAKGFTRFKELEERRFAEYVLIGTLSSSLLAVLVASMVKLLLP